MNTLARSNKRTEVLFTTADKTYADKIYGGGFGAWTKMFDRAVLALTGLPSIKFSLIWSEETGKGTLTHRATGEVLAFEYVEVK
jgi:hypothetical protein